jgi:signal transduction histidine kinase
VELLEQVLINLLINAMEALEGVENPVVKLVGRQTEGSVEIQVVDNGPGIPAEILEHIFVPFYTTKKTGSGVGLSLARQIMRLHKGSIAVQSPPGEGTRVVLSF